MCSYNSYDVLSRYNHAIRNTIFSWQALCSLGTMMAVKKKTIRTSFWDSSVLLTGLPSTDDSCCTLRGVRPHGTGRRTRRRWFSVSKSLMRWVPQMSQCAEDKLLSPVAATLTDTSMFTARFLLAPPRISRNLKEGSKMKDNEWNAMQYNQNECLHGFS